MTKLIRILPAALAVLCLFAFVPWTLGIPGTENDYARGWTIGYFAIIWYLVFYAATLLAGLLRRWLPIQRPWLDYLRLAGLACFIAAQIVAWPLILS